MSYGWAKDAEAVARQHDRSWLAFVGEWDHENDSPEGVVHDSALLKSWPEARRWMIDKLLGYIDDECESCQADGIQALIHLILTGARRSTWTGEVDGIDYVIRLKVTGHVVVTAPTEQPET